VVCGSRLVASSGFMERQHLPRNAGAPWKKRAIVPHMHPPVLLLRTGRPAVPLQLQRAHFAGGAVVACCHFLATAYHRHRQGASYKEAAGGAAGQAGRRAITWRGSQVPLPPITQGAAWVILFQASTATSSARHADITQPAAAMAPRLSPEAARNNKPAGRYGSCLPCPELEPPT
jgi:hypothetical protein